MPKEEIIAGLKQAVSRGSTLGKAKQSFINAGYNPEEVEEAASFLGTGTITKYTQFQKPQQKIQSQETKQKPTPLPQTQTAKQQKSRKFKKALIIFILFLIIVVLAGMFFLFKDELLGFVSNLI